MTERLDIASMTNDQKCELREAAWAVSDATYKLDRLAMSLDATGDHESADRIRDMLIDLREARHLEETLSYL